jgi:hypothetical protein
MRGVILLATSPRLTAQAVAFDVVGRNAILRDPHYHGGQYYDRPYGPRVGLALARMIGHITYLSPEAMTQKFEPDRLQPRDVAIEFEKRFSVGSYLGYQGAKFVERFDANSYLVLSMAMDLFDLGRTPADLASAFQKCTCRWLVMSFTSDWLFPPEQSLDDRHRPDYDRPGGQVEHRRRLLNINPFKSLPQVQVPVLSHPFVNAFIYGLLYGPIALPCSGPLVVSIFALSLTATEAFSQLNVFFWFGMGFGIPLLLLSFLSGAAQRWITRQFAIRARLINIVSGLLLLAVGIYDLSVNWPLLRAYL